MSEIDEYKPTEEDIQKQEEFFSKEDKDKERALLVARNMAERDAKDMKLLERVEADKKDPNTREIQKLNFGDLNKGDVLIFESMASIDFHKIPDFFDKLDQRAKLLPQGDPKKEEFQQIAQSGRVILEDAYSRPVGEGRRQLLFRKLGRIISSHPGLFTDEEISRTCRLEVVGRRIMQSEGEKKEFVLAEVDEERDTSDYRPETIRIPVDTEIEDVRKKLGVFRGRVKEERGRFSGGYHIDRIGKIFYKSAE